MNRRHRDKKERNGLIIALLSILVVIACSLTAVAESYRSFLTTYLGESNSKIVNAGGKEGDQYFTSEYDSLEKMSARATVLALQAEEEGATLLENDGALPLMGTEKVSLFSVSSCDFIYSGGGAGAIATASLPTLKDAFEWMGFSVNPTLWNFYKKNLKNYGRVIENNKPVSTIGEIPLAKYTEEVKTSVKEYSDAAVVVLSRATAEASDCLTSMEETGSHYLALTAEEKEMIDFASSSCEKTIVLLNTANPMELDYLDGKANAVLWCSYVGENGIFAIPEILCGEVDPSGRLTDTYARDLLSSPAMANFPCGAFSADATFPNKKGYYSVYAEGIYTGYRYYETRYEDVVLSTPNTGEYDYAASVRYPFGYGLSYTQFSYTDLEVKQEDGVYTAAVTVTNAGRRSGKEVVQLYLQKPYTAQDKANGTEQAAAELVGFAKTRELSPNESERVTIDFSEEEFATFLAGGYYYIEEGRYYLSIGENVHAALNNILAAKGKSVADGMTAAGDGALCAFVDVANGRKTKEVQASFDFADLQTYDENFTYLSRQDWTGTFPTLYRNGTWKIDADMVQEIVKNRYEQEECAMPTTGADNGLELITLRGESYDSPYWDMLLDQLSAKEMIAVTANAAFGSAALPSIGKPETLDKDGPAGITSSVSGGVSGEGYPCEILLASSWNESLLNEIGRMIGEEGLYYKVNGWYAPGLNLHRTPFGGRNFEYYSEDSFLSGKLSAAEVKGAQSKGMYCYLKHFVLNDSETWRYGVATFCNEQALRSLYLSTFQRAVEEGGARGVMVAFCSLGPVWCGASKELVTNVLRGEWGFEGVVVTDTSMYTNYTYYDAALYAGTDLELNTLEGKYTLSESDPHLVTLLRRSMHNLLYVVVNSAAMNGIEQDSRIVSVLPPWEIALIVFDCAIGLIVVAGTVFLLVDRAKSKGQNRNENFDE